MMNTLAWIITIGAILFAIALIALVIALVKRHRQNSNGPGYPPR